MNKFVLAAAAVTIAMPAAAQTTVQPVVAVARPVVTGESTLPANTEISVTMNSEINSKKIKQGEKFDLSVSRDVMLGDYVVIPRGALAHGSVTYRTGKGAFGKSAKIEIDITSLDVGGRSINVAGHFRQEGQGNTGAAVGAVVAVGVFGAFVTGHSAVIEQGREFKIFTREPIPVTLATGPAVKPAVVATPAAVVAPAAPVSASGASN